MKHLELLAAMLVLAAYVASCDTEKTKANRESASAPSPRLCVPVAVVDRPPAAAQPQGVNMPNAITTEMLWDLIRKLDVYKSSIDEQLDPNTIAEARANLDAAEARVKAALQSGL